MIYTITFDPAIDYYVTVPELQMGTVTRAKETAIEPGGKGLNVSTVLHHLGVPTTALGFLAGETGDMLAAMLAERGVPTDLIRLPEGRSRINVKLHTKTVTEINGAGPAPDAAAMDALYARLDAMQDGDTLVLAGSVPQGVSDTLYCDILERVKDKQLRVAVDASGDLLRKTLAYHPFLIKPNHIELGALFGVRLGTPREAERYARRLQDLGAQNVLVSMGERGAVLVDADGNAYARRAMSGKALRTTGAGDSMLAGFLAGCDRYGDLSRALTLGIAAASATVFSGTLSPADMTAQFFETMERAIGEHV